MSGVRSILDRMIGSRGFLQDGEPYSMEHPPEGIYEAIRLFMEL